MPQLKLYFFCRKCQVQGTLEALTKEVNVVECPECGISEVWGEESMTTGIEHFTMHYKPVGISLAVA